MARELLLLTLGPHAAAAVAVRGFAHTRLLDADAQLACAITFDRQHVVALAARLLARIP